MTEEEKQLRERVISEVQNCSMAYLVAISRILFGPGDGMVQSLVATWTSLEAKPNEQL